VENDSPIYYLPDGDKKRRQCEEFSESRRKACLKSVPNRYLDPVLLDVDAAINSLPAFTAERPAISTASPA
jgi:hypothetical protein